MPGSQINLKTEPLQAGRWLPWLENALPKPDKAMCNLYSITKGQKAIRDLAKAMADQAGNLPPMPGIFPDQMAPVVATDHEGARTSC